MSAVLEADIARTKGQTRTIPNTMVVIDVTAVSATADLASVAATALGRWVLLRARGGNVTIRKGAVTVVANEGLTIADGTYEEFYVPLTGATTTLSHIGSGVCKLEVLYDTEN